MAKKTWNAIHKKSGRKIPMTEAEKTAYENDPVAARAYRFEKIEEPPVVEPPKAAKKVKTDDGN